MFLLVVKANAFNTLAFLNLYKRATSLLFSEDTSLYLVDVLEVTVVVSTLSTLTSFVVSCAWATTPIKRIKTNVKIAFMTWVLFCKGTPACKPFPSKLAQTPYFSAIDKSLVEVQKKSDK